MTLLSAAEMAAIRTVAESGMVDTVVIKRRSTTEGDYGDVSGYTEVATVRGWITELTSTTAALENVGNVEALAGSYRLFVPVGTDLRPHDEVTVNGHDYIVQNTDEGNTYEPMLRAFLRRPG